MNKRLAPYRSTGRRGLNSQIAALESPPTAISAARHAGFWIRLAAGIIDLIILGVPMAIFVSFLSVATGTWYAFLNLHPGETPTEVFAHFPPSFLIACLCFFVALEWLYFAKLESSSLRATVGKFLLGLYLADASGNRISFWRASQRFSCGRLLLHVPILGAYYFLVDCVSIGVTPRKRAIHDLLSGCFVMRGRAAIPDVGRM